MKNKKWIISAALLLSLLFTLSGCNIVQNALTKSLSSGSKSDTGASSSSAVSSSAVSSSNNAAGMQTIDTDTYSFEIPTTWQKTSITGVDAFVPGSMDAASATTNIIIKINPFSGKAPSLADYKSSFAAAFEKQLKTAYPDATNFQYSDMKSAKGDVFIVKVQLGSSMFQTQYYPINDKATVVLAVTTLGEDKSNAQDVMAHILDTLVIK